MIWNKRKFYGGAGMMLVFIVLLILIYLPVFKGQSALGYLDALYSSISKDSAYYIPKVMKKTDRFIGNPVTLTLVMSDHKQSRQTASLFIMSRATVSISGNRLEVAGDLGKILQNCLVDADFMYNNDGSKVFDKYGYEEKRVLFNWWKALKAMDKDLQEKKKFNEAEIVSLVVEKAVEPSYNFYKVKPQNISKAVNIVIFSLAFYVLYTVWYGFAIMFMFEGWGMR